MKNLFYGWISGIRNRFSLFQIFAYIGYKKNFRKFLSLTKENPNPPRFSISWHDRYPCLNDITATTPFDPHYVYHPAWAARIIKKINPSVHIDISSTLCFCTMLSAFIPVKFYDYRPAHLNLNDLTINSVDLTNLPFEDNSIHSVSCMHTIEHIGLGRYGDPLDPDGDLKAIHELQRVLAQNGDLLIVVPVGKPRIMFNAHRIYSFEQILKYFEKLTLMEFSLIPDYDEEGLMINATKDEADNCDYGCGCFWFKRIDK